MPFCFMADYTPEAVNALMDHTESRLPAVKKLAEAAGGKVVSMYSTAAEGPGVMVILDVPEPNAAMARSPASL
ncbi:MAG: GYD domain-containing protein [Reyranella sp.]